MSILPASSGLIDDDSKSLVTLGTTIVSGTQTTIPFDSVLSGAFREYILYANDLEIGVADDIGLKFGVDGVYTATNVATFAGNFTNSFDNSVNGFSGALADYSLTGGIDHNITEKASFTIEIKYTSSTSISIVWSGFFYNTPGADVQSIEGSGEVTVGTSFNSVQLLTDTALNFTDGTVTLYGVSK